MKLIKFITNKKEVKMNKQGTGTGLVGKILLALVLVLALLSGFNNFLIGMSTSSLVRILIPNSALGMRIMYGLMSVSTLLTAILLFFKVYIKKE